MTSQITHDSNFYLLLAWRSWHINDGYCLCNGLFRQTAMEIKDQNHWQVVMGTLWWPVVYPHNASALQWRHNERDGVSNHQPHDCLLDRLFKSHVKENIKAPRHWLLCEEFIEHRWIPSTNGQKRGKCFHLMTSSCRNRFPCHGAIMERLPILPQIMLVLFAESIMTNDSESDRLATPAQSEKIHDRLRYL